MCVDRLQLAGDSDGETFPRELVDDVERPELAAGRSAVLNEVIRPHVIAGLGPEPDTGAVVEQVSGQCDDVGHEQVFINSPSVCHHRGRRTSRMRPPSLASSGPSCSNMTTSGRSSVLAL